MCVHTNVLKDQLTGKECEMERVELMIHGKRYRGVGKTREEALQMALEVYGDEVGEKLGEMQEIVDEWKWLKDDVIGLRDRVRKLEDRRY